MPKKAKITVHPAFRIGDISPRLYSSFLEPIGTMVNGTMFNPKHPTADDKGFRGDIIAALRNTPNPAVRLPGAPSAAANIRNPGYRPAYSYKKSPLHSHAKGESPRYHLYLLSGSRTILQTASLRS